MDSKSINTANNSYKKINILLLFLLFLVEVIDNFFREKRIDFSVPKNVVLLLLLIICTVEFFSIIKRKKDKLKLYSAFKGMIIICSSFLVLTIYFCVKNHGYTVSTLTSFLKLFLPVYISFVVVNTVNEKYIYYILVTYLVLSFVAYILTIGFDKFTVSNLQSIDFIQSYSPFESNFFSPSALALFLYFIYNNKRKWTIILSAVFVVLTFKRFMILAMIITLFLSKIVIREKTFPAWIIHFLEGIVIMGTWGYMLVMEGELDDLLMKIIGVNMDKFSMGRGWLFENLKYNFTSYGFGSAITQARSIEMDLPLFYLEMGIIAVIIFVHFLYSMANQKSYSVYIITIALIELMTSHFYDISFFWIIFYFTISCVESNYRNSAIERKKMIRIRVK